MQFLRAGAIVTRRMSTTAFKGKASDHELEEIAHTISERVASNQEACTSLVEHLDSSSRQQLILALAAAQPSPLSTAEKEKLDLIFSKHDIAAPYDQLSRQEFESAMQAEKTILTSQTEIKSQQLPQPSNFSIALANCLPFIGMGAVDNAIMLVAGSKIDAVFGAKLGLSTLAAAGLGNMVSDVAGVSMANRLEDLTRRSKWVNQVAYKAGNKTPRGRVAKLVGAIVGVSIGCLIGMAPLLFMDTHAYDDPSIHNADTEAAAA